MRQFDPVVTHIMGRFPTEFVNLFFNEPGIEVVERLDTKQATIKVHQNDLTFKVQRSNGEMVIFHIEVQTYDSTDNPMPLRVLNYAAALILSYGLPVYSMVIYLHPDAGRGDPGTYRYGDDTMGLRFNYKVICLSDLEGEPFLESPAIGLLPFTPLMKPPAGMTAEAWVEACVAKTQAAPVDSQTQGTLLFALSLLGSLAHDPELFRRFILEEIMRESPFYDLVLQDGIEQGIEQGIAQGVRETSIRNIIAVLTARFPDADIHPATSALEVIGDIERLTQLHTLAVSVSNFTAFLQVLDE